VNILCHSDSSPPLTACTILVIVIDISFVEQVEEYTSLNTKSKDWLARNQNNVSEWSDIFTCGLLYLS
jgi:hypothetical protein